MFLTGPPKLFIFYFGYPKHRKSCWGGSFIWLIAYTIFLCFFKVFSSVHEFFPVGRKSSSLIRVSLTVSNKFFQVVKTYGNHLVGCLSPTLQHQAKVNQKYEGSGIYIYIYIFIFLRK